MENQQPSGSFKLRGIGHLCTELAKQKKHFISSSGGNAGLAAAYAGRKLGIDTTVIVPETTPRFMREKIEQEGANLRIHGTVWDEADHLAKELAEDPQTGYIPPFDHPLIWQGNASLIHECNDAMPRPDAVVVSIGGGGLMAGVLEGMHDVGWEKVPLIAVETEGAASFAAAAAAKRPVSLARIDSIAKSLGSLKVCQRVVDWIAEHPIHSLVISDAQALNACLTFAEDHRVLVEPACGAALAAIYDRPACLQQAQSILAIVCGGAAVDFSMFSAWQAQVTGQASPGRVSQT